MLKKYIKEIIRRIGYSFNSSRDNQNIISKYRDEYTEEAFQYFKKYFNKCVVFDKEEDIRKFAINEAIRCNDKNSNDCFLEFGVFKGNTINFFAKILKEYNRIIYGFDSFLGLEENWTGTHLLKHIAFNTQGKVPMIEKNVVIIKGKIEETLDDFIKDNLKDSKINFMHLDFDTFTPTNYVFKKLKKFTKKNTVILFDELYGFPSWKEHEFKALINNFIKEDYDYIAFSVKQAAIIINKDIN